LSEDKLKHNKREGSATGLGREGLRAPRDEAVRPDNHCTVVANSVRARKFVWLAHADVDRCGPRSGSLTNTGRRRRIRA